MAAKPDIKFVDNPLAPELYASGATGFFVSNGTITITLESIRADHAEKPGPLSRTVVARLTMPAARRAGPGDWPVRFSGQAGLQVRTAEDLRSVSPAGCAVLPRNRQR